MNSDSKYYNEEIVEPLLPIQRYILWSVFIIGIILMGVLMIGMGSAVDCSVLSNYKEMNTTGARFYINESDARIYCVQSTLTSDELTTDTGGLAFFSGTSWVFNSDAFRNGANFPANIQISNSTHYKMVANDSELNYTVIYDVSNDFLDVFFNVSYIGGNEKNRTESRFVMNWNLTYFGDNEYYITSNDSNVYYGKKNISEIASQGSNFGVTMNAVHPNNELFSIEKVDNNFEERVMIAAIDWLGSGSELGSIGGSLNSFTIQRTDRNQTSIQSRYNILNSEFKAAEKKYGIYITNSSYSNGVMNILGIKEYNEPINITKTRGGWWQFGCGTNDWITYSEQDFIEAKNRGVSFVQLHCWFPAYGNYSTEGTWTARSGGSIDKTIIQEVIILTEQNGMKAYLYYNPQELYDTQANSDAFSKDRLINSNGDSILGFRGGQEISNTTLMSLKKNNAWYNFTKSQLLSFHGNFTNLTGIFFDRMDYNKADYNHTSGRNMFVNSETNQTFSKSRENLISFMDDISLIMPGEIICNTPSSFSFIRFCDAVARDNNDELKISALSIISKGQKPGFFWWIGSLNFSEIRNSLILWGIYPAYDSNDLYDLETLRLIDITSDKNISEWHQDGNCVLYDSLISCRKNYSLNKQRTLDWYDHNSRNLTLLGNETYDINFIDIGRVVEFANISQIIKNADGTNTIKDSLGRAIDSNNSQEYFKAGDNNKVLGFYELSNALLYNTNNSIYGSSNINDNDGNINITLPPNNASFVLDNFNLTEGIIRQNSPLSFVETGDYNKIISSSLLSPINSTIAMNVASCSNFVSATFKPSSGEDVVTYTISELEGNCSNNVLTLELREITTGQNSFEMILEFSEDLNLICTNIQEGLGMVGGLLIIVALVVVFAMVIGFFNNLIPTVGLGDIFLIGVIQVGLSVIIIIIIAIMVSAIC